MMARETDETQPIIRRAAIDDSLAMAKVYTETWHSAYAGLVPDKVLLGMVPEKQAPRWARDIERGPEIIYVAELADRGIVGLGSAGPNRQRGSSFAGEVYTLYVSPDFHDQGIGSGILQRLFEELLARSMGSAVIWVLAANPSRFFYEAQGGTRLGERTERLWGTTLHEGGYGWPDLAAHLRDRNRGEK